MQTRHDPLRIRADTVAQFDQAQQAASGAYGHECAASPFDPFQQVAGDRFAKPLLGRKSIRTEPDGLTLPGSLDTAARHRLGVGSRRLLQPIAFAAHQDGPRERMRRAGFQRDSGAQKVALGRAAQGMQTRDLRFSHGDRPGLVHCQSCQA